MNRTFWPETASGPAIPRKLAVRYSYGVDGPVKTVETPAVPHETVDLLIQDPAGGGNGGAPAAAEPPVQSVRRIRAVNEISAEDLEGCWGCFCLPGFCACERKRAEGPDVLVHEGVCLPLLACYSEPWDRVEGTNTFKKRLGKDVLDYEGFGGCLCTGLGCSMRFARCNMVEKRPPGSGKILASEIQGCWGCMTNQCLFSAIEYKKADGEDAIMHQGCCFPLLIPFNDRWEREGNSNVFKKDGKDDRVEYFAAGGPIFGPRFCSCRLCKC